MKKLCGFAFCLLYVGSTSAQSSFPKLEAAKALLKSEEYVKAERDFREIYSIGSKKIRPISGLYLGVCLYNQLSYTQARKQFEEVAQTYPKFELQEALIYWQALSAVGEGKVLSALGFLEQLSSSRYTSQASVLRRELLDNLPKGIKRLPYLAKLYEAYPTNTEIEKRLQTALRSYVLPNEESEAIDTLFKSKWGRKNAQMLLSHSQSEPRVYHVAVLLPFFLSNWQQETPSYRKQSFVWSFYEGLCSAQSDLEKVGVSLRLYPYDTRRNSVSTQQLLSSLRDKSLQLIIGPLYWEAISEVQLFAKEQGVPILNPLSANPRLSQKGTESWLFQPNELTRARAVAAYANDQFKNQRAAIFCEQLPRSNCYL